MLGIRAASAKELIRWAYIFRETREKGEGGGGEGGGLVEGHEADFEFAEIWFVRSEIRFQKWESEFINELGVPIRIGNSEFREIREGIWFAPRLSFEIFLLAGPY